MSSSAFEIPVSHDRVLRGDWHLPRESVWPAPVVFFCQGFKGFKDWGAWPWFCEQLSNAGFGVLRFNFSLGGVGPAKFEHDEPEKFNRNTYGHELEDLKILWESEQAWGVPGGAVDRDRGLALVGHSRGGLVSLLHSSESEHVRAVVSLAAPGNSQRFDDATLEKWRQEGTLEIKHGRTGQIFRLERSILEDFERQRQRYDLSRALDSRSVPTLVVHGTSDETVDVQEAHWIYDALSHQQKELLIVPDTGHTFGVEHPFGGADAVIEQICSATAAWLEKHHSPEQRSE